MGFRVGRQECFVKFVLTHTNQSTIKKVRDYSFKILMAVSVNMHKHLKN